MTWNDQFYLICNFSNLLPLKHLIFGKISKIFILGVGVGGGYIGKLFGFPNFFKSFHTKMRLKLTWNGQFNLIHNFFHLLSPKHLFFGEISKIFISGGRYIGIFFKFFNFFKSFHTNLAENDPQWQILPKKWLRLCQNGQFGMFFYLLPQNNSELSISPDSQLFPSFATKASHFWRNLKNFHFWGGGYIGKFFRVFQIFQIVSHQCG